MHNGDGMNSSDEYFCIRKKRAKALLFLSVLLLLFIWFIYFIVSSLFSSFYEEKPEVKKEIEVIKVDKDDKGEELIERLPIDSVKEVKEQNSAVSIDNNKSNYEYTDVQSIYDRVKSQHKNTAPLYKSSQDSQDVTIPNLSNNSTINLSEVGTIEEFKYNKTLLNDFIYKIYYELNSSYKEVIARRLRTDSDGDLMISIELNGLKLTIYYRLKEFYFDRDPNYLKNRLLNQDLDYEEIEKIKIYYSEVGGNLIEIALIKNGILESITEKTDDTTNLLSEEKFIFIYTQLKNVIDFKPTK
jgi:hypothetical protein